MVEIDRDRDGNRDSDRGSGPSHNCQDLRKACWSGFNSRGESKTSCTLPAGF